MIEGPGVALSAERLRRAGVVGQVILAALGACFGPSESLTPACLAGLRVLDVVALGKELFLFLAPPEAGADHVCVRLHFGMSGSLYVNATHRFGKQPTELALELRLSRDVVRVYQSTVCRRCPDATRARIAALRNQDVCGPCWDEHVAAAAVLANATSATGTRGKERLVVDALLDQSTLPGSGNIIKNEALFLARMNPFVACASLSMPQATALVRHVRNFSLIFKRCRESGKSLKKHCNVYNRRECGVCSREVRVCRLGNDLSRVTFWCRSCQPESAACAKAAFVGGGDGASDAAQDVGGGLAVAGAGAGGGYGAILTEEQRERIRINREEALKRRRLLGTGTDQAGAKTMPSGQGRKPGADGPPLLGGVTRVSVPQCPQHRRPCHIKRVRKPGPTHGRLFFSCNVPSCAYFQWADVMFPRCGLHPQRPSILRSVLKQGPNNGRRFFSCHTNGDKSRPSGCNFFQWAPEGILQSVPGDSVLL